MKRAIESYILAQKFIRGRNLISLEPFLFSHYTYIVLQAKVHEMVFVDLCSVQLVHFSSLEKK